ncbi:MAG: hypothetical protein R2810_11690 [Flavobacteriales bacterium]
MGTNVRTAAQALKVLELNGDLALSDGFRDALARPLRRFSP